MTPNSCCILHPHNVQTTKYCVLLQGIGVEETNFTGFKKSYFLFLQQDSDRLQQDHDLLQQDQAHLQQ